MLLRRVKKNPAFLMIPQINTHFLSLTYYTKVSGLSILQICNGFIKLFSSYYKLYIMFYYVSF